MRPLLVSYSVRDATACHAAFLRLYTTLTIQNDRTLSLPPIIYLFSQILPSTLTPLTLLTVAVSSEYIRFYRATLY